MQTLQRKKFQLSTLANAVLYIMYNPSEFLKPVSEYSDDSL